MIRHIPRFLPICFLSGASMLGNACGTTCEELRNHRQRFALRTESTEQPHGQLTLPYETLNAFLREQLEGTAPAALEIPRLASLAEALEITIELEQIRVVPGGPGLVGLDGEVLVRHGAALIATCLLEGGARPVIDAEQRAVAFEFRGENIERMAVTVSREGREHLRQTLEREIGQPGILGQALATAALAAALDWLQASGPEAIRELVINHLGRLGSIRVGFGSLPLRSIEVRSSSGDSPAMIVQLWTTLPVQVGVTDSFEPWTLPSRTFGFELSGSLAAELGNSAMQRGRLPSRFQRNGDPDPTGPFEARLGWQAGERPLLIHLWQLEDDCMYARVAASPRFIVDGEDIRLEGRDGVYDEVLGSGYIEALAWTQRVWSPSIEFAVGTARELDVRLGDRPLTLSVSHVELTDSGADVRCTLVLSAHADDTLPSRAGRSRLDHSGAERRLSNLYGHQHASGHYRSQLARTSSSGAQRAVTLSIASESGTT